MHPRPRSRSQSGHRPGALAVTGILLLAVAGCSGDGQDTSLKAAQAKVTASQNAG